jgi:hypothetical protein
MCKIETMVEPWSHYLVLLLNNTTSFTFLKGNQACASSEEGVDLAMIETFFNTFNNYLQVSIIARSTLSSL